jgi:hypothetical protein
MRRQGAGLYYRPDTGNAQGPVGSPAQGQSPTPDTTPKGSDAVSFEDWVKAQPDEVRARIEQHTAGLKGAYEATKRERQTLAQQVADLTKQAADGSEARKALETVQAAMLQTTRQNRFYESAPADLRNLHLAWLAAEDAKLVDAKGETDWKRLREIGPELFQPASPLPPGHAGNGSRQTPVSTVPDMNALLRRAAGRGR